MRYGILIRLIVLYKVSTLVQSETRQDSGEDEISEIEALLDYEQGLIYYKDIGLQLCFVENVPIKLNSREKVELPILKIPIVSPDGSNLTYNESSKSMQKSALGLTFCDGLAIVHQNELLQETVRSNRKKRQTYGNTGNGGYYGGGSGQYPLGAAGAQTNTNPGQASQAQVQGQVFGRGIFSGQAQSQNGGLSQSQVQLAGIGVSGQISSSSGNAQAQLALGTGAGSGQASGLGVGPSNSQVQVTLGQQGEESMASASATSGGASAGASSGGSQAGGGAYGGRAGTYGQPGGGGTGWIPGVGYGGNRGQLESVSPGILQDASGRGGAAFYPGTGSQIPQQNGGGGIPSGSSHGGIPGGGVGTHYGGNGVNGVGGHPSYTQPGSINGLGSQPSLGYGGGATNGYGSDSSRFGSGLRTNGVGTGLPTNGHQIGGSGLGAGLPGVRNGHGSGISSDLSTSGTGYPQGTRPLQAGNGGVGTLPISAGQNGQHSVPGTYVRPGVPGYDSQGTGVGTNGLSGTGISAGRTVGGNGYNTGTNGGGSGYTTGTNGGGANGKYGGHGPASGTHGPTFGNGNGRPFAQSNTPGAYAATYGGIGQAQAQTVYFGNIGNGQYVPVRYAQSSQPGNGRDQSRYQDQQVGYGTAGQRQQVQGPQPSQNGYGRVATNGVRAIQPVTNGYTNGGSGLPGTNGHQPTYTNGGGGSLPGTNGHQPAYTNGGGGSLPGTNGHQTGYTNGGSSGLPGTNGHQTAYTNGGGGSLPGTNGHQTGYTNGAGSGVPGTNGHQTGYTNGGASGLPGVNGHQTGYTNGGGSGAPGVQIPTGTNGVQTHTGDLGATRVQQQPSTTGTALGPGQLGFDGTSTGTTGLQGPLGPGIAQPQTTGYTNGVSRGVKNGYRPATTIPNGRNGHSYTPAIRQPTYTSYPGSGISTPAVNGNGQAYRINEYGQVVPASQQTRPQQQPISGLPGTLSQGRDQNGYSPSYGVAKPSQEDPDGKKCTIITFSCTIVIESNGRAKICKPNAVKMNGNGNNGNGNLGSNGNGRTGGSGSNACCC